MSESTPPSTPVADAPLATCHAMLWIGRCGDPATHRGQGMCVHEHIRGGPLCAFHAQQAQDGYTPDCAECDKGETAHRCPVTAWLIEPLTDSAERLSLSTAPTLPGGEA